MAVNTVSSIMLRMCVSVKYRTHKWRGMGVVRMTEVTVYKGGVAMSLLSSFQVDSQ